MPPKKAATEEKILLGRPSNNLKIGVVGLPNVGYECLYFLFSVDRIRTSLLRSLHPMKTMNNLTDLTMHVLPGSLTPIESPPSSTPSPTRLPPLRTSLSVPSTPRSPELLCPTRDSMYETQRKKKQQTTKKKVARAMAAAGTRGDLEPIA